MTKFFFVIPPTFANFAPMNLLKSTWIWLCRFRHRKGYGVHSPFAFQFIRTVLNERESYYAYRDLQPLRPQYAHRTSASVDRLLLRLANFAQPRHVVMVGADNDLSFMYIQAGCKKVKGEFLTDVQQAIHRLQSSSWQHPIDLLVLGDEALHPQLFQAALAHITPQTVVVVQGLYNTPANRQLWRSWVRHESVVQAFDLYECGVLLFNTQYQKQTFKVNFIAV